MILENGEVKILSSDNRKRILEIMDSMSNDALRCIAGAYKNIDIIKKSDLEKSYFYRFSWHDRPTQA